MPGDKEINQRIIDVTAADLPLHCPTPEMKLWNGHPRVFLEFNDKREALCPYCGTMYKFKGEFPKGHH